MSNNLMMKRSLVTIGSTNEQLAQLGSHSLCKIWTPQRVGYQNSSSSTWCSKLNSDVLKFNQNNTWIFIGQRTHMLECY